MTHPRPWARLRPLAGLIVACACVGFAAGYEGSLDPPASAADRGQAAALAPAARASAPSGEAAELDAARGTEGLDRAAALLAKGDTQAALGVLAGLAEPQVGEPGWFRERALRGRALRQAGRSAEALAVLEPLVAKLSSSAPFVAEVAAYEIGSARYAWARQLPHGKERARGLERAAKELVTVRGDAPVRYEAPRRVLAAKALAEVAGPEDDAKTRHYAAKRALPPLEHVLGDYPNLPAKGELLLARARLLGDAGDRKAAAAALREIAIERAGEPEAARAWDELGELGQARKKLRRAPFSTAEQLRRAEAARRLRRLELSRSILDELLQDKKLPASVRQAALASRAATAYKARDYATCAADRRALFETHGQTGLQDELVACLERAHQYDEAVKVVLDGVVLKKKGQKTAAALWRAIELFVLGGRHEQATELLRRYASMSKGHAAERRWLEAWLAYRRGDVPAAIAAFEEVERRRGDSDDLRARYFRGKLMSRLEDPEEKAEGLRLLAQLAKAQPLDYYGLFARQRITEAGGDPGPLPVVQPMSDEATPPGYLETAERLRGLAAEYGAAWPSLERARQLYDAGYLEEARREFRALSDAFSNGAGNRSSGARNEDLVAGLGWRSAWKSPKVQATAQGRKLLRDRKGSELFRRELRLVALGLDEPHRYARLSSAHEYGNKARWHPRAFRPTVTHEAKRRGFAPTHLWALMYTESRFRRHVVSPVGARGALQIMPWTARQLAERLELTTDGTFDPDRLFDLETNVELAAYYVSELLHKFHAQPALVYASYNGGPDNVERWVTASAHGRGPLELDAFIEEIPFRETYRYTKRVLEVEAAYQLMYEGKLTPWPSHVDPIAEANIDF